MAENAGMCYSHNTRAMAMNIVVTTMMCLPVSAGTWQPWGTPPTFASISVQSSEHNKPVLICQGDVDPMIHSMMQDQKHTTETIVHGS